MATLIQLYVLSLVTTATTAIQCYSGSDFQIIKCESKSCIKQTLGVDTVRYCDGTGISSICKTYRISDSCESIPNLGYICCCSGQLCNTASKFVVPFLMLTALSAFLLLFRT